MILKNKLSYLLILLLFNALLAFVIGSSWPLLILSIVILSLYLPLPAQINSSVSIRILISLMIIVSSFQIEGFVFYLLKIDINPFLYNLINATIATILAAFVFNRQQTRANSSDLWVFIVPVLIAGTLIASTFALTSKTDLNSAIIYKTTTSTDESQHLYMLADLIENNSNYTVPVKIYPTGWHLSMSLLIQSFADLKGGPFIDVLIAYYITKMFSIFIVVASIMALFIAYAKKLLPTPHQAFNLLFALGTIFITLMIVIPNSEINAFYNFTPQYIYFILLMIFLLFNDKNSDKITYIILGIFVLASFLSWILSGALLALFVTIAFASRYFNKIKGVIGGVNTTLLQLALFILLGICAILLSIPSGLAGKIVDTLEHPGGWIEGVSQLAYLVIFILVSKYILASRKLGLPLQAGLVITTYFAIVASVIAVTMLRGYGDDISYYWQKIQFPLLIISIPLAIVILILLSQKVSKSIIVAYVLVIVILVLSIPNVFGVRSFSFALRSIGNKQYLHKTEDLNITRPIKKLFETNRFQSLTAVRYVFATSTNYTLDQMVYQLMSQSLDGSTALNKNTNCFPPINVDGGYVGENAKLLPDIPAEYCGHRVVVVVSDSTVNEIKQYVSGKQIVNIDRIDFR